MKILCLLTLLANIFLLSWEYRTGAFSIRKENSEQLTIKGKEHIFLIGELNQQSHSLLPNVIQNPQPSGFSSVPPEKEMQDNLEPNTPTSKQTEYPQVQLP
jgi:hypothetical protein